MHCSDSPSIDPSGPCDPGFFCSGGAADSAPLNETISVTTSGQYCLIANAWIVVSCSIISMHSSIPIFYKMVQCSIVYRGGVVITGAQVELEVTQKIFTRVQVAISKVCKYSQPKKMKTFM